MRSIALFLGILAALYTLAGREASYAQALQAPAVVGTAVEIPGVISRGTPIERIITGYDGLDDPIGLTDGTLVFSEPGARRIHRLNTRTNEVSVLVAESNESHGMTEDRKGRLISAQAWDEATRIGVIHPPGGPVLSDNFEGRPFSRPNDLIVATNGGIYFTDPGLTAQQAEALVKRLGKPLGPRLPPAVYYIPPGGRAMRIEDKMIRPNGLQLSRDEKTLYISDSNGADIIAWDVQPDGLVRNRRAFGTLTGRSTRDNGLGGVKTFADGMTIDNDGRIYVATGSGVEILSADGRHLGTVPVRCPPADCQNIAFGGPDRRTLYVAGAGSLYKIQTIARGFTGRPK
jgi:gluconolactonase